MRPPSLVTLVNRIEQIAVWLDPRTALAELRELIREAEAECAERPPGDPAALDRAAAAFGTARETVDGLDDRSRAIALYLIPAAWTGLSGTVAADAITATADGVSAAPPAFGEAQNALTEFSGALRQAHDTHADGLQLLASARRHLEDPAVRILGFTISEPIPDPSHLLRALHDAVAGLRACTRAWDTADAAGRTAANRLRGVAGEATVGPVQPGTGLTALDAVVLSDQTIIGTKPRAKFETGVLTKFQLARAESVLLALPAAEADRIRSLLTAAKSDRQRAYILKALAADHSVDEVARFAGRIRGLDRFALDNYLSAVWPGPGTGFRFYDAHGVAAWNQYDQTTCGEAVIIAARAMTDPIYTLELTAGGDPEDATKTSTAAFDKRYSAEQQRLHDAATKGALGGFDYPQSIGTPPWSLVTEMNAFSGASGVQYRNHWVDHTDSGQVDGAITTIRAALDEGRPVPVLVGGTLPRHWVLAIGHEGDEIQFYNPWNAGSVKLTAEDLRSGSAAMDKGLKWDRLQAIVAPVNTP